MNKQPIFFPLLLSLLGIALGISYTLLIIEYASIDDITFIGTNLIIILYCLYRVFKRRPISFSLYQMFYLFSLFFFGFAPFIQYLTNTETVQGYTIYPNTYCHINFILLSIFIFIDIIYFPLYNKLYTKNTNSSPIRIYDNLPLKLILSLVIITSVIYVLYLNKSNFMGILLRGGIDIERNYYTSSVLNRLMELTIRPLPIFAFIYYYCFGHSKTYKILLGIISLFTCFPASLARLAVGTYYIPILIIVFPILYKRNYFACFYIFSMAGIFPIFELFRDINYYLRYSTPLQFINKTLLNIYTTSAFDSYQSLAFVFQKQFITYGQQLLGVLGIAIPRSLWPGKPIGTGFTISHLYNLGWENIAMNFFGEGYANFGLIGIFLFAMFLSLFMVICDTHFWKNNYLGVTTLNAPCYLLLLGVMTYILRGDLMGGATVLMGTLLSCLLIKKIFTIFMIKNKK